MNINLIHNVINVAIAGASAALVASGCTESAAGAVSCERSWLGPEVTVPVISGLAFVKIGMNLWRDGFGGLYKPQPKIQR